MKKFLAILLAAMLVLSMTAVAFAEDEPTELPADATKTFYKVYNLGDSVDAETAFSPAERFTFSSVVFESATDTGVDYPAGWAALEANLPTIGYVEYTKGQAGSTDKKKPITVTLPTYPAVGVYTYSFSEVDNKVAGVTYNATTMYLVVTVTQDTNGQTRVSAIHCEGKQEDGSFATGSNKKSEFVNTYSAGTLSVKKSVFGNLGDKNKDFDIKVIFTAPQGYTVKSDITYNDGTTSDTTIVAGDGWTTQEVTIHVKNDETVTFYNVPVGVTYKVEETDALAISDYTIEYDTAQEGTITVGGAETTVKNTKENTINTGITTDTLPYVLLLGIVLLAGAAMIIKRRAHNN